MPCWLCASHLCLDRVQRSLPSPVMDLPQARQMLGLQRIHKALPEARHKAQELILPIPLQCCFHNPSAQTIRSPHADAMRRGVHTQCPTCI